MTNRALSRRSFLKITVAAGAALTATSFLPAQWLKPVVQTGVLPAHAQTSVLSGSISGTLTHPDLKGGTSIGLFAAPDGLETELTTTSTNGNGEFTFSGLTPGLYEVAFSGKGSWYYRSKLNGAGSFITVTVGGTADGDIIFPYPPI